MGKKVLILTSEYTGHGHKSVTQALKEQLHTIYRDQVDISVINGFELANQKGIAAEKSYSYLIKYAKIVYKIIFEVTSKLSSITNTVTEKTIKRNFIKLLESEDFELVISVHPVFVGSVAKLLEQNTKKHIPFIVLISDLVRVGNLWVDNKCDYIICPTEEMKKEIIHKGISKEKVFDFGFPIRNQFKINREIMVKKNDKRSILNEKNVKILILNASETPRKLRRMICRILEQPNLSLTVIAGRDEKLKKNIEERFGSIYGERLTVEGYTTRLDDFFLEHDILITRGGPNTLMEAVSCQIPVIVTGEVLGQEEGNADFIEAHHLGIKCYNISKLPQVIFEMLADERKLLRKIRKAQSSYQALNAIDMTVELVEKLLFEEKMKVSGE